MEIIVKRFFSGRNIYCHRPVMYLEIKLGSYGQKESKEYAKFNEKLLDLLPKIGEHKCGVQQENGFLKRLEEGTYFGHILEHISLEILNILGYKLKYGKTRLIEEPDHYYIVFESPSLEIGEKVAELALKIILCILEERRFDFSKELLVLQKLKNKVELGPSTLSIYEAAKKRRIPVKRLDTGGSMLQLGTGKYLKLVEATITSQTSAVGVDIACDKTLTKKLLEKSGICVPVGRIATSEEQALQIAKDIGTPVVIKPCDGNQGKGVTLNLKNETEIRTAYKLAENYSDKVIVEKHITGKHYRILVINNEVVAVSERLPAHVIGNGSSSIKELIEMENENPLRGEDHDKPLTKIKVDPVVFMALARQNMTINYIPQKEEVVFLRENANISTGGVAIDVTDDIHKDNVIMAKRIVKVIGLDIAGIDIVTEDISKSISETSGAVIEVNAAPGIRMHLYPSVGKKRAVAEKIIDYLYPDEESYEIPIISITGTNGKTTTARLISHVLKESGLTVGTTTTDGIFIDGDKVMDGDNTGPISAQVILDDPTVEVAVLETARGGIVKRGLGYNLADIAVITNISDDHLGQDGVKSLDDLFFVKSLVAEAVKDKGYLVLNADDDYVRKMSQCNNKAEVILFSLDVKNKYLSRHLAKGGKGIYLKDNIIYLAEGDGSYPIISLSKIPFTIKGKAVHNVQNTLAATGAMVAFNMEKKEILKGLQSFDSNIHNPGRLNIYEDKGITILLDYGHNQDGYTNILKMAQSIKHNKMILVLGAPGDRKDKQFIEMGEISAECGDIFIIKEDEDLRGREPSEVARLFKMGVKKSGRIRDDQIYMINDEAKAIEKSVNIANPGDLIIIFYEKYQQSKDIALGQLKKKQINIMKIV